MSRRDAFTLSSHEEEKDESSPVSHEEEEEEEEDQKDGEMVEDIIAPDGTSSTVVALRKTFDNGDKSSFPFPRRRWRSTSPGASELPPSRPL